MMRTSHFSSDKENVISLSKVLLSVFDKNIPKYSLADRKSLRFQNPINAYLKLL